MAIQVTDELQEGVNAFSKKRSVSKSEIVRRVLSYVIGLKDSETLAIFDKETKQITLISI